MNSLALALLLLAPAARARSEARKALVLGLDGLEWSIVRPLAEAGRLPNLARMIREGASGTMSVPFVLRSPALWTTIATSVPPSVHGIEDFFDGARRVTSAERRAEALWESAELSSRTVACVGWLATWPAEPTSGVIVSDQALNPFVREGLVSPAGAMEDIPVRHAWDPKGKESARRLARFLPFRWEPGYKSLWPKDSASYRRHDLVARRLSWVYVRDESNARMAERLLRRDRPDLTLIHIWGIDQASHAFWRHAFGDASVEERRDFGGVVEAYYEYVDELVGRLRRAAGSDALVMALSDHGFQSWTPPPGDPHPFLSGNHTPEAVFILAGPGVRAGLELARLSPLDAAPTVLRALDAEPPDSYRGRVVTEAFEDAALPAPRRPRPAKDRPVVEPASDNMSAEELERMRAAGYMR